MPSGASREWNLHRFHTETAVADGGGVAVNAVKGSPFDGSASGWSRRNLKGDR